MPRRARSGRPFGALALVLCLVAAIPVASAFDWIGKVELAADGLKSPDPDKRLEAVRRLSKSDIAWTKKYLLGALGDPDVRVRSAAGRVLARAKVREAVPVVKRWLAGADRDAQLAAAEILGELADPRAVPDLVRSIGDQDPQVRVQVVTALGKIGTPQVVVPLINRLEDDKAEVRQAAVDQLMNTGDKRAVIPLVALFDDPSMDVRRSAILAVGRLGDRRALPALMRLLNDPQDGVVEAAVTALGNVRATSATDTLIGLLKTGSEGLKAKVAYSLGQIARAPGAGPAGRRALDALVESLADGRLRAAAREALAAAGPAAVPALIAQLDGKLDGDPATVVTLLRDIGDPRATPALIAELDRGRLSRQLVLGALGRLGDKRALVPVLGLLNDKDQAVRLAAMKALRPMLDRGSRAADVIADLLDDPAPEIRVLAAEYLGLMQSQTSVPRLITLAGSHTPSMRLRQAAVAALGEIGSPRATGALLALLRDGPAPLHVAAANSLIYIQDPAAVKPLLALLGQVPASSRALVVRTLGGVLRDRRDPVAQRTLDKLTQDGRLDVSLSAVAALGAIADPASMTRLVQLVGGSQMDRRRAAVEALGNISLAGPADRKVVVGLLRRELDSTDDRVAAAAAWALGKQDAASVAPALITACRRQGFATPVNASAALALVAGPGQAGGLLELLHHKSRLVRTNAAAAVARLGLHAGRTPLRALLTRDDSWLVRAAAARALSRLGGARAALERAAGADPREEVRAAARAALAGPFVPPARSDWRDFYFVDPTDGDKPVEQEPYFVAAADGLVTALYTDARGEGVEERFPPGAYVIASALEQKEY